MSVDDPDYAISRLDSDQTGTHGWQVRLQRKGVRFGRFFSDSGWGGRRRALMRAKQFRDRILGHVARQARHSNQQIRVQSSITKRNQSGVVGVSRISQIGSNGTEYHFWQATWSPAPGKRKSLRFSVLKLGDEEAFRLACVAREEGVNPPE